MSSQSNQTITNSDGRSPQPPSLVSGSSSTARAPSSQTTPRPGQRSPDVLVRGSSFQATSGNAPDQTAATAGSSSPIALQSSTPSRRQAAGLETGRSDEGHSRHFNSTPPVVNRHANTPRNDGQSTHGSHEISPSSPAYWAKSWAAEGRQRRDSTPTPNPRER